MQNPLENFLLNLAEKIQTEKEYKEIIKNSESVDVNKDVFAGFIEGIANTIKENVKNEPTEEKPSEPDPLDNFLSTLGEKLKNLPENKKEEEPIKQEEPVKENEPVKQEEPVEELKPVETKPENEPIKSEENETPDAFAGFVNNLANILKKTPEQKTEQPVENEKPKEQVNDYVKVLSNNKKVKTPEIKNVEKKPEENEETPDIKKFVTNFVSKELEAFKNDLTEKYLKKAAVLSEYAGGGGSVAVQYANGGVMNGDLNVNGHILSGGRDISNFFGNGGGGGTQTLSFNSSNADLSISGGNTVSLSALSGGGGSPTDRLVSGSFLVVLSSDGTTTIPGLLTVPNLSGGAILTAAGYDDIEGFYGQSNIPVIQNGINGTIDISNVGVVTVSNSGENYTNGIAIIGGGTRIIISVTSPGWVYNSNGSITFPNGSTQTTAFTGNPDSSNWDSTYTTLNANSANYILDGGNTKGSNISIGTNDAYNLSFETNAIPRLLITSDTLSGNSSKTSFGAGSAAGLYSFATGYNTTAFGNYSYAEGINNTASGYASHAQGQSNVASGENSHAQGKENVASGESSYAGGGDTLASGLRSTATGQFTSAVKTNSYASGKLAFANHNRSWVWQGTNQDGVSAIFASTRTDQFAIRPTNGFFLSGAMGIGTDSIANALTVVGTISTNAHKTSQEWSEAYTNLISNSAAYLSGADISLLASTSGSWNSNYTTTNSNSANWNAAYAYASTYPLLTALKISNVNLGSASFTNAFTVPAGRIFMATGIAVIFDSGVFTNLIAGSIRLTRNNSTNSVNRIIADLNIGAATYSNNTLLRRGSINDNVNTAQPGEIVQIAMNTLTTAYTASVITEGVLY